MFCICALTKTIVCYSKQVNCFLFSIYLTFSIYFFTLVKLSILFLLSSHAHKT